MRPESSIAKRLLKLIAGVSAMTLCAASTLLAAPATLTRPDFSKTLLDSDPTAWAAPSTIPNALADYYTYIPLSNADARALGFPVVAKGTTPGTGVHSCGNPNPATNPHTGTAYHTPDADDLLSNADCYVISVREFKQPTSLEFLKFVLPEFPVPAAFQASDYATSGAGVNLFSGPGLLTPAGTPFVRQDTATNFLADVNAPAATNTVTTAWGYGSGGQGWAPFGAAGPTVRGNAPWAFQTTPFNYLFGAAPTGDQSLSATGVGGTGVWHFPAPTLKGTKGRPVYVQWVNDLPNKPPLGLDPSVDCGHNAEFCYPYNRMIVHVHGSHVGPESDGLAFAWMTPNWNLKGEGFFPNSAYRALNSFGPINYYPMDQEAGTIWYHDHAVGTTHNNTDMGMAGFFPITDKNEKALITAGTLPTEANEHGFALQERHFDTTAQMRMPDYGIYDKTYPGCDLLPGDVPNPTTCPRVQWMKEFGNPAIGTTIPGSDPTPAVHFIPYDYAKLIADQALIDLNFPGLGYTVASPPPDQAPPALNPLGNPATVLPCANAHGPFEVANQCAPFPATSATLEYFGNIAVINGVTYGNYTLKAGVNRMRFIGGTDSRTWILKLQRQDTLAYIPFYQIGSEQGLLNQPVLRNELDIMPGERLDVLVDLTGLEGKVIDVINVGDDAPYSGYFDYLAGLITPSVEIPKVFQLTVSGTISPATTSPSTLVATPNSLRPRALPYDDGSGTAMTAMTMTPDTPVRTVSLIEITDQYGRTMPTVDARGFIVPGMMLTEYIKQGAIEQWDIVNTTVDAHPMHIHQVAFQMIDREPINAFAPPQSDVVNKVFSQPSYVGSGSVTKAFAWEGMKDTAPAYPGYVVRVIALYDMPGEYVWHCHILSHEEHDMMRPFMVATDAPTKGRPYYLNAQVNNGIGAVKLSWNAVAGATGYVVHSSPVANFATSSYAVTTGAVTSALLKNVADGTYYYRIAAIHPTTANNASLSAFTATTTPVTVNKTVAAPYYVTAAAYSKSSPNAGLIKVTFAASATPSTFADPALYYSEGSVNLVTYDVTATNTSTLQTYTTTGITSNVAAGQGITVNIGNFDPVTGLTSPLPNGTYAISVVANKGSWKPSAPKAATSPVTVNIVLDTPYYITANGNNTYKLIKVIWATVTGGTIEITQSVNGGPATVVNQPITVTGASSSILLSAVPAGSYVFTVQNKPLPGSTAAASGIKTSPAVVITP